MKNFMLSLLVIFASAQVASAASLRVDTTAGSGGDVHALYLEADEQFNGFGLSITPASGDFLNVGDGTATDDATTEKTFLSAFLEAPVAFGGWGLSVAGKQSDAARLGGDYGLLGAYIDGTTGIHLGNLYLPAGALAQVDIVLQDTGNDVATISEVVPVPEPGTFALAGLSLVGLALRRRS